MRIFSDLAFMTTHCPMRLRLQYLKILGAGLFRQFYEYAIRVMNPMIEQKQQHTLHRLLCMRKWYPSVQTFCDIQMDIARRMIDDVRYSMAWVKFFCGPGKLKTHFRRRIDSHNPVLMGAKSS